MAIIKRLSFLLFKEMIFFESPGAKKSYEILDRAFKKISGPMPAGSPKETIIFLFINSPLFQRTLQLEVLVDQIQVLPQIFYCKDN